MFELLPLLCCTAAQNNQRGSEHSIDVSKKPVGSFTPFFPGKAIRFPGLGREEDFRRSVALQFNHSQLNIGNELAIDQHSRTNPCAECHHQNQPGHTFRNAEPRLG